MKRILLLLFISLLLILPAHAQTDFASLDDFRTALDQAIADNQLDSFWDSLVADGQVPFVLGEDVAFLYRGEAETVEWRGDFTFWNASPDFQGERIGESDLWLVYGDFPTDARLDYKIVLDGQNWILDPANPLQQMGGFGPNSELRMPDYISPTETIPRDDIAHGTLKPAETIFSKSLNYPVNYRVYQPADYNSLDNLPVIYVTDGQEYADPLMGSMVTVLDNLIADGKIRPVLAVFIDPRNPDNPTDNRRERQYEMNPDFIAFVAQELVPLIDILYKTDASPQSRATLGTSLGGVNSVYLGLNYPDVFGLVATQSPAFWVTYGALVKGYEQADTLPLRFFVSSGRPEWDADVSDFLAILDSKGYDYTSVLVNEGHSWGNWRALLDDLLIDFFPAAA